MATMQDKLVVASGQSSGGKLVTKLCEYYDSGKDQWHSYTEIPLARVGLRGLASGSRFYVTGGRGSDTITNRCDVFDPKTGVWTELMPMHKYRAFHAFVEMNGKLVVMGGDDENTVEVYDPKNDTWTLADIQLPGSAHAGVATLF